MKPASKAIQFLESLGIPEGPKAGDKIKLAPFQKQFVRGALDPKVNVAILSIGRGNAKTALSAGIALGAVMGEWDRQPRREIIIAAQVRVKSRTVNRILSAILVCRAALCGTLEHVRSNAAIAPPPPPKRRGRPLKTTTGDANR